MAFSGIESGIYTKFASYRPARKIIQRSVRNDTPPEFERCYLLPLWVIGSKDILDLFTSSEGDSKDGEMAR